jgi:hypothetical protein
MRYQCLYCKASYNHDQSYQHNAYDCPKVRGKGMKKALSVLLIGCLVALSGCETIKGLLPKDEYPVDVTRAELQMYTKDKVYKYVCTINPETKSLTDCREVQ